MMKNIKTQETIIKDLTKLSRNELENSFVKLETQVEELSAKIAWYEEQYRLSKQKIFGSSSEKTDGLQISLFNEPEAESVPINIEPTLETVTYKRKKKNSRKEQLPDNLPVETIEYRLSPEEQSCPQCGESLHEMSKEIRQELKIIPAQVTVVEHIRYVYSCRNCEKNEITTPVITAPMPNPVIKGSLASPSFISYVMTRKYVEALPLYRQEQQFERSGIILSRQTLSNWMIRSSNDWLSPIYNRMHSILVQKEVLHADETVLEVLNEPGRPAQTNSYMWMYRTSGDEVPIVLYEYKVSRSGDHPKIFLKNFKGFIHVDGYAGYHKVENATLVGCWAHARRKITDALKALPKDTPISTTAASKGLEYCNQLFAIERELVELTYEERYEQRLLRSKAVVDAFFAWLETQKQQVIPKSSFGSAVTYCLNQRKKLEAFLLDGRLELSNNRGERAIKPFVIGRKNWLFSNTPKGAASSAVIYSVVETAKENKLNLFEYLKYLFEQLPNVDITDLNIIDKYLPWSDCLPQISKAPIKA